MRPHTVLVMLLIKNFHADDDDIGSAYGGGGGLYPPPPIVAPYVGNLCIIVCRHMYMLNARIFTSARVCRHSVHISVLFTFECIFHVVGQFGENIFFSKLKCFYRLEIGTMHCNASLYISYTWHYLYILFQQNNLLLSNITCIQIGNSHTHKYANLVNFTGKLRTCWISVRSTSTSSLHQNVAHEPRSRIFSFDLTEHWTLNTEHWTLNSGQMKTLNTETSEC